MSCLGIEHVSATMSAVVYFVRRGFFKKQRHSDTSGCFVQQFGLERPGATNPLGGEISF